jgi:hypothetical protein
MALAYTTVKLGVAGNYRVNIVDVALDATYAAGGYLLSEASLGVSTIHAVVPSMATATDGLLPIYDAVNKKLLIFKGANTVTVTSGNAEFTQAATNDTLVSATTIVRCLVIGDSAT